MIHRRRFIVLKYVTFYFRFVFYEMDGVLREGLCTIYTASTIKKQTLLCTMYTFDLP